MRPRQHVPNRGEVVRLEFDPQTGDEQAGRRPAVVLSPQSYNQKTRLALFCPVTSQVRGYPFEVSLPAGLPVQGVVLCDQIKSLAWVSRKASLICALAEDTLDEVMCKALALIKR